MYNLYAEKEKMLEEYYKTGIFPYNMFPPATTSTATSPAASERQPRPLYHDPIKFVLLHLFFGVSTSLMYFSCRQLLWWTSNEDTYLASSICIAIDLFQN